MSDVMIEKSLIRLVRMKMLKERPIVGHLKGIHFKRDLVEIDLQPLITRGFFSGKIEDMN